MVPCRRARLLFLASCMRFPFLTKSKAKDAGTPFCELFLCPRLFAPLIYFLFARLQAHTDILHPLPTAYSLLLRVQYQFDQFFDPNLSVQPPFAFFSN